MKEHIETITDLLLGAAYADKRLEGDEINAIRTLLCKLLGTDDLPSAQADQIASFKPAKFDPLQATAGLKSLPESDRNKVVEMVIAVNDADEELDFDEDRYLTKVAKGLGLDASQFSAIVEIDHELDGALAE